MLQVVNVELPGNVVKMLDDISPGFDRATVLTAAIEHYTQFLQKENLREQIKAGAINRAERDRQLSEEWFSLEEEACHDLIG
jgi:CopG family transcriptional regulator / antitoxin EndoAI